MSKIPHPIRNDAFATTKIPPYVNQNGIISKTIPLPLPSNKDIGKRVRVGEKEAILRYIGNVHFATGVWCGVELPSAVGKNDGLVNGVRYFRCSKSCGLMTPLSKVTLVADNKDREDASGPYSILFVNQPKTDVNKKNGFSCSNKISTDIEFDSGSTTVTNQLVKSTSGNCDQHQPSSVRDKRRTFDKKDYPNEVITVNEAAKLKSSENLIDRSDTISRTFCTSEVDSQSNKRNYRTKHEVDLTITKDASAIAEVKRRKTSVPESNLDFPLIFDLFDTKNFQHSTPVASKIAASNYHPTDFHDPRKSLEANDSGKYNIKGDTFRKCDQPASLTFIAEGPKCNEHLTAESNNDGTSNRGCYDETVFRKNKNDRNYDEESKRDSLDCEESLGILTEDQMYDGSQFVTAVDYLKDQTNDILKLATSDVTNLFSKSKNSFLVDTETTILNKDDNSTLTNNKAVEDLQNENALKGYNSELQSPNVCSVATDFSLGILDENILSNLTLKSHTTMNMELPLDTLDKSKNSVLNRLEQTPSPEDLPLDPTPIVESDQKTEPTKSKTNSFITSITSITSLDTGYQGDGEMSRPASRGADNSPLTRRPLQRPPPRRPDPMTDSDFYTESDADNHEENQVKGDRRAQVIDGTLYGVDPQEAADIYVNNRENMDSSGIFTDIESNPRSNEIENHRSTDISPSDSSTKTISGNSQNNMQDIVMKNAVNASKDESSQKENIKKRNVLNTSVATSAVRSTRMVQKDDTKKYKSQKRESPKIVPLSEQNKQVNDKKVFKKPPGRWDAVMDKISKSDQNKVVNLKEVKSKVFTSVSVSSSVPKPSDVRNRTTSQKQVSPKQRRVRTRINAVSSPAKSSVVGSVHSSLSDLSANSPKKPQSATKKREPVQLTQVLTPSKLSPRTAPVQYIPEGKKLQNVTHVNDIKNGKKNIFPTKEKKIGAKECARGTIKGSCKPPVVRSVTQTHPPTKTTPKAVEALAVLVHHLVYNVQAFRVPILQKELKKYQSEADKIRLAYQHLEKALAEEKQQYSTQLEHERERCRNETRQLEDKQREQLALVTEGYEENKQRLIEEYEHVKSQLIKQHEEQLSTLKSQFLKLQKTHEESLDILREENDAIRERIDEKNEIIDELKQENLKLKGDSQIISKENQRLKLELAKSETNFKEEIAKIEEKNTRLLEENERLIAYRDGKGITVQEVESIRSVLVLKQEEVAELRKALAEATQKAETLAGAEEKAASLQARLEDLQYQLQQKVEFETSLLVENKKLRDSHKEEINQKQRLHQHNEELQWKLKQNKEVITKILEQTADETYFSKSVLNASFSEFYTSTPSHRQKFDQTSSDSNHTCRASISMCNPTKPKNSLEHEATPPTSPKVKGVVEKSDSVSYVLDLEESPDIVASRIRRSFRNSTPPKNTPTKSPSNKRPRMKSNPLSLSSSTNSIVSPNKIEYNRSRSVSGQNDESDDSRHEEFFSWTASKYVRCENTKLVEDCELRCPQVKIDEDNLDFDDENDVDLKLPALPSEIGRSTAAQILPSPKHLAGEAMVSESNSDDESTSSLSGHL